jgi:hypothetical protein
LGRRGAEEGGGEPATAPMGTGGKGARLVARVCLVGFGLGSELWIGRGRLDRQPASFPKSWRELTSPLVLLTSKQN